MNRFLMVILAFAAVLFVVACGGDDGIETPDTDTVINDSTTNDSTVTDTEQPDVDNYVVPDDIGAMIDVPAGEFQMGCNEAVDHQCGSNEYPYHAVTLSAYKIGKYEVTVAEYQQCVTSGACKNSGPTHYYTNTDYSYCNLGAEGKGNHPMQCVTWHGAKAYCEWIGGRLPTEAEWEKAARGTDGRKYPWGNTPTVSCDYAVMAPYNSTLDEYGCGAGGTMPVGSKPNGVSPYGAYDMIGNVWEWVNDWSGEDYYETTPTNNPAGPETGAYRVLRGGAWDYHHNEYLRASNRDDLPPGDDDNDDGGFRCAK